MRAFMVSVLLFVATSAFGAQAGADQYKIKINNILGVPQPGVLKNDKDVVSLTLTKSTDHGSLTLNSNGSFTYKPNPNFVGRDRFTYQIGTGSGSVGQVVIDVYSTARATLSGPSALCEGETAELHVDFIGDSPYTVEWTDGVVQTGAATRITRQIFGSATTAYTMQRILDKNGPGNLGNPYSTHVRVERRPTPAPAITGSVSLEPGEALELEASGNFPVYQWYFNGAPIAGANFQTYARETPTSAEFGTYTVTGRYTTCHSFPSAPMNVALTTSRVIPVVGAAEGAYGSSFRSAVQLHNPSASVLNGTLDAYGAQPGLAQQTAFTIPPFGTIAVSDVRPILGDEAIGSLDVSAPAGPAIPDGVVRIYNDEGALGTAGANVPQIKLREILHQGETAALIGPDDPRGFRFNVGIRTFSAGATMNVRSFGSDGKLRILVQRYFPPDSFRQLSASQLTGIPLTASEAIYFDIVSGSAVVYGATVENRTNDPMIQLAERIDAEPRSATRTFVIPAAASQPGAFGAWYKTSLQVHNPGGPMTVELAFRPALQIGGSATKKRIYKIVESGTLSIPDLLPALGVSGFGSLDVTAIGNSAPVFLNRIFHDGLTGQTGTSAAVLPVEDVPHQGDRVLLIAPADASRLRFNIGIRTLGEGATVDYVIRKADGSVRTAGRREYPTNYLVQQAAGDFAGVALDANDTIEFRVVLGAAVIYGSANDNATQDPSIQMPRAVR